MDMVINRREIGDTVVFDICGAFCGNAADSVVRAVRLAFDAGAPSVVINLAAVRAVDLTGLGGLLEMHALARTRGRSLRLAAVTEGIQDLLVITRLLTVFETCDSVEHAVGRPVADPQPAHAVSSAGLGVIQRFLRHV
jgi:anti-sigma B factor antagonist